MRKNFFVIILFSATLFLLDRFFKYTFLQNPDLGWDFVFKWRLSKNFGIVFNIAVPLPLIIALTVFIIFILVVFLINSCQEKNFFNFLFLNLIIAGAFSNFLDRVKGGFVIDYIDVPYFTILNLADVMITTGAAAILFKEIFFKKINS